MEIRLTGNHVHESGNLEVYKMRGHLPPSKNETKIRHRMTPDIVLSSGGANNGILTDFETSPSHYRLLYRIWGSHQRLSFQNKDMGYLEINNETSEGVCLFRIKKKIVNHENLNQHIEMNLVTRDDEFLTPVSFGYASEITDNALCSRPDLSLERSGTIENGRVMETVGGNEYARSFKGRLVFDTTVYDLVFRKLLFGKFTYHENLYAFKQGSKIQKVEKGYLFEGEKLDLYLQRGFALTECNYYSNATGTPVVMIQNSVAYILDFDAKSAVDKLVEDLNR